jgi:hypothetical protein
MFLSSMLAIQASIYRLTGFQLMVVGGLFLCAAALLLAISRERRIAIKRSVVTDEMAIHAGRIADALERLAGQAKQQGTVDDSRWAPRTTEVATTEPKSAAESRHVSYSMFGR